MKSPHLRLGIWQAEGTQGDVAANLAEIAQVTQDAADSTDLLIFPECFLTGYYTASNVPRIAAQVTPDVIQSLADLSARTGVALVVGSYEPAAGAVYNSAFAITPKDGHVGTYRKRMLFGDWEKSVFRRGAAPFVFDFHGFRIGVLICFDIEFPERARDLARLGVDLIATPTASMVPYQAVADLMVPARAMESQCFIAYANRIGRDAAHTYFGESRIVGPMGELLAPAGSTGLIRATLDLSARKAVRDDFDYLAELDAG